MNISWVHISIALAGKNKIQLVEKTLRIQKSLFIQSIALPLRALIKIHDI